MLICGLINSIFPRRVLSQLTIYGEPQPKSNNSPILLAAPEKTRPQIATPTPLEIAFFLDPLPLGISVALSGEGMDIFWNHTLLRNWGINISVAAVRDLNIPITFSSSKESLNFALPFSIRLFPPPFHFSSPLFYPCHGCVTSLLLEAWNCKICRTREWSLSRSWPLIKEENWAGLTFAKTSGTVTRARAKKKSANS